MKDTQAVAPSPNQPQVVGQVFRIGASSIRDYPELIEHFYEGCIEAMWSRLRANDMVAVGDLTLQTWWARMEKVAHHAHGWQWEEQQCAEPEATMLVVVTEVRAVQLSPSQEGETVAPR